MDFEVEMRGNIERIEVLMSEDEARSMHEFDNNPECISCSSCEEVLYTLRGH